MEYHDVDYSVLDTNGEHKVTGFADALAHQEGAVLALVHQYRLRLLARGASVEPSARAIHAFMLDTMIKMESSSELTL